MTDDAHPRSGAPLVLMVCSSGGHLAQLLTLDTWSEQYRTRWVTFGTQDARSALAGRDVVECYHPTTRHLPNLLRNTWLAWRQLRRERPAVVVSSGAAVAVPFFVLARLLRVPTVYVEVFDRIDSTTMTGRLVRPFSTLFCVQWDEQLDLYPGSVNVGALL